MALAITSEGTQSATPATEHSLYDASTAGTFLLTVDTTNLSGTEYVELRAYTKAKTGGSYRQVHVTSISVGDPSPAAMSMAFPSPLGIKFTLKQVGGSSRNFDWGVWSL